MSYYLNTIKDEDDNDNDIPDDYGFMNPVKDNLLNADQAMKITNDYKTNMYNVTIDKIATNIRGLICKLICNILWTSNTSAYNLRFRDVASHCTGTARNNAVCNMKLSIKALGKSRS